MSKETAFWSALLLIFLAFIMSGCNPVQTANPTGYITPTRTTLTPAMPATSPSATIENDNLDRRTDHALQPTETRPPPLSAGEGKIVFECSGEIEYRTALCVLDSTGVRWLTSDVLPGIVYGYSPRLSPDGQVVAFVSEQAGSVGNVYLTNIDGSGLRRLTDMPGGAKEPTWSPDGTKIAFTGWSKAATPGYEPLAHIFVIQTDGSSLADVTGTGGGSQPDWSPDGQRIVFAGGKGIAVINVDGTDWMDIIQFGYRDYFDRYFLMPRWSPDGREIALVSMRIDGEDYQLYLFNLERGSMTRLTNLEEDHTLCPTWSPDGRKIAFSSGGGIRWLDLESGNVTSLARGECPSWGP